MERVYSERIEWKDEPSIETPINEENLNKMDYAIFMIDGRVVEQEIKKANQSDLLQTVKSIDYNTETGVFTFTWQNGNTKTVDLNIEAIPVSFTMDENGIITMITQDGSSYTADVGKLIKTYSFEDGEKINFIVETDENGNKNVKAGIVKGSITEEDLQPQYLADITVQAERAAKSATNAATSYAQARSYAVGDTGTREGENTDNAKYYYEQAKKTDVSALVDRVDGIDEEVSEINNTLSYYEEKGFLSNNLLYKTIDGYYLNSSGAVSANSNYRVCVAKVESGKTYHFTSDDIYYSFYNAEPTIGSTSIDGKRYSASDHIVTVPNGVTHIGFLAFMRYENPQINEGTEALPYTPYAPSNIELGESDNIINEILKHQTSNGYLGNDNLAIDKVNILVKTTSSQVQTSPHVIDGFNFELGKSYVISARQSVPVTSATRNRFQIVTSGLPIIYEPSDCVGKTSHIWVYTPTENRPNSSILIWGNTLSNEYMLTDLMITEGTEPKPYSPYSKSNYGLTKESLDLKMLGWTVPSECPIQNTLRENNFIQKVGRIDLGSLTWTKGSTKFYATVSDKKSGELNIYCNAYNTKVADDNKTIKGNSENTYIYLVDNSYSDANALKSALQGTYVYYELATPSIITIDGNEAVSKINENLSEIEMNFEGMITTPAEFNNAVGVNIGDRAIIVGSATVCQFLTNNEYNFVCKVTATRVTNGSDGYIDWYGSLRATTLGVGRTMGENYFAHKIFE